MIEIIATVVIAIATGALVFVTWQYAKATQRYVETTEKALKAADTPNIRAYLSQSFAGSTIYTLDLCIHNIGTGFAYDIKFRGKVCSLRPQFSKIPLGDYSIMRNGISHFAPGKQCRITLFFQYEQENLPQGAFDIIVDYMNSAGEKLESKFYLDFNQVEEYPQIADPSLYSIASSLRFIYGHFLELKKERDNQKQQR